jgi:hypothetical protein
MALLERDEFFQFGFYVDTSFVVFYKHVLGVGACKTSSVF